MPKIAARAVRLLAPLACFVFAVVSLAFVVGPGDGTWQLYAREMLNGKRLYADLGLNQQPLFPLLNLIGIKIFSENIIALKLIFVPVIILYIAVIFLICRENSLGEFAKSILFIAVFFVSIRFEAFRFDDYQALTSVFVFSSVYASIILLRENLALVSFCVVQAVLVTAAALTRPNDGLALAGATATVLLLRRPFSREFFKAAALGVAAASIFFLLTLACIHETPASWIGKSVFEASTAKGGGGVVRYPELLLVNSFQFVAAVMVRKAWTYVLLFLACLGACVWMERRQTKFRLLAYIASPMVLIILILKLDVFRLIENLTGLTVISVTIAFAVIVAIVLRNRFSGRPQGENNPDWSLLAYPFFLFYLGSLSSAGEYYSLYTPVAITLLVIATVGGAPNGVLRRSTVIRAVFLTCCAAAAWQSALYRWYVPYSWLSYRVPSFSGDYIYRNDAHGPHFIPAELAKLVDPVCTAVKPEHSLLSLPYSFANYYCGIPPWHGYVQTFFDTSTGARISRLMGELGSSPPEFIFYQRQMPVLRDHEVLFNHGAALPHRALDTLIMTRIESGEWSVIERSSSYPPSTWLLIRTHGRDQAYRN